MQITPHLFKKGGYWWCKDKYHQLRYVGMTPIDAYQHWESYHCLNCKIHLYFPLLVMGIGKFCSKSCIEKHSERTKQKNT